MPNDRILFVDDEEMVLKGIERQQGDEFDITTAIGPEEALEVIQEEGPFAVVVSDMRMPVMNGSQLLKRVREVAPDTIRMILTGYADLNSTIDAINEGHIFRFLTKPCDEDVMASVLNAGLRQFALVEAEKELVEGTLHGSVKVLADVLSLMNPLAFGQSTRVRATVDGILKRVEISDKWQLEIASMLFSLGCITLPTELLSKKLGGEQLTFEEEKRFGNHPELPSELLQSIPRLDEVSAIIGGLAANNKSKLSTELETKLEILRLAIEFDYAELSSISSLHALADMDEAKSRYSDHVFSALNQYVKEEKDFQIVEVELDDIRQGMVLADDVRCDTNLLMTKGQTISKSAITLLENHAKSGRLTGKLKIVESQSAQPAIC